MRFRIYAAAAAAALMAGLALAPAVPASAGTDTFCSITVKVTHTRTSTTATLTSANPCNRWFWPWGSFEDPVGVRLHNGHGVQSGSSTVTDNQSSQNILGGWKWSGTSGVTHQIQTY